jgi:hypothetical protein
MYLPFLLWQSKHFNYLTIILCLYTHTYKQEWYNLNRPWTEFNFAQSYLEITYRIFKIRFYISILFSYLRSQKRRDLIPFKDVNINTKSKLTIEAYSKIYNEPDCIKDELHKWDDGTRKFLPRLTLEKHFHYRITSVREEVSAHRSTTCYGTACTKAGQWAVMYLCVRSIDLASFYNFDIWFWTCADSV